jgi:hypothetical protein
MSQLPCPKCGGLLTCAAEEVGRTLRCHQCGALLRLDAETPGPAEDRHSFRARRRRIAIAVVIFLLGAAVGFGVGRRTAPGIGPGTTVTAVGGVSAQNNVVIQDGSGGKPQGADGDAKPGK